ncbi:MAG TPA: DUF3015 family protein [Nitrospira sp.]|jgi:Protein of unknown function (DUF3015)|nr:DUF3015 family protein [Nitrospira sp.]
MPRTRCALFALTGLAVTVLSGCTITGTIEEILDTTTNVTVSTSGRTWWNEDGLLKSEHKAIAFAAYNQANLEQDIANGGGEYLASLGSLLGVSEGGRPGFALGAQSQFQSLIRVDDRARLHTLRALVE